MSNLLAALIITAILINAVVLIFLSRRVDDIEKDVIALAARVLSRDR